MKFYKIAAAAMLVLGPIIGISAQVPERSDLYRLQNETIRAYVTGNYDLAAGSAKMLLEAAPNFKTVWNYGDAIHAGHLVLGKVALSKGNVAEAKKQLLLSVAENALPYGLKEPVIGPYGNNVDMSKQAKASPSMDTFGPDMSLAAALLAKGENETVLRYLELCGKFWRMDNGNLVKWRDEINKGEKPNFGPNLVYVFGDEPAVPGGI